MSELRSALLARLCPYPENSQPPHQPLISLVSSDHSSMSLCAPLQACEQPTTCPSADAAFHSFVCWRMDKPSSI